jgi:RNA polymerase sigma-70 factor (ECF subfamily)
MAAGVMNRIVKRLTKAVFSAGATEISDGQLLDHFLARQDEVAFEALVRRHGPMVLGVCRRILGNHHDAEEAFQATFYILVRKADSIVPREMVGNWLYGVAYRTAMKARTVLAKRRDKERPLNMLLHEITPAHGMDENLCRDLQEVLDYELHRLPDKYRVPVVLCDLEGKTRQDVARQLGWTEGTLSGRLARARELLTRRLARRGVAVSAGALVVALSPDAATAALPPTLLNSTVQTATLLATGQLAAAALPGSVAALTEGVIQAMWWTKVKIAAAVVLAAGILGTGIGFASHQAWADRQVTVVPQEQSQVVDDPALAPVQGDTAKEDDGDNNNKDDGQENNKDDKNKNNKDDGQKNNKDDKNKNDKDDGQKNNKNDGNKINKDDKNKNDKNDGDQKKKSGEQPTKGKKDSDRKDGSKKENKKKDKKDDDDDQ